MSPYAKYYPAELGKTFLSRMLKDYNGQTYWLSFNIGFFFTRKNGFSVLAEFESGLWSRRYDWCQIQSGFGQRRKPSRISRVTGSFILPRMPILYRIPSNSSFYNAAAYLTQFSKLPAPALEWSKLKGLRFHPFYY